MTVLLNHHNWVYVRDLDADYEKRKERMISQGWTVISRKSFQYGKTVNIFNMEK